MICLILKCCTWWSEVWIWQAISDYWYLHALSSQFMESPLRSCWTAVKASVQSTTFLSAFVGIFQVSMQAYTWSNTWFDWVCNLINLFNLLDMYKGVICLHRKVAVNDHKLVYWLAGGIAALSVLLEKKTRRVELALYVLPRAGDSLWYILVNRHFLPDIKNVEVLFFVF